MLLGVKETVTHSFFVELDIFKPWEPSLYICWATFSHSDERVLFYTDKFGTKTREIHTDNTDTYTDTYTVDTYTDTIATDIMI